MAEDNGSSNTAIVAIIVLVAAAIAFGYFFGFFGAPNDSRTVDSVDRTTVIERPGTSTTNTTNTTNP